MTLENIIIFSFLLLLQVIAITAGCSGNMEIPVKISQPKRRLIQGRKTYLVPDVTSLANQLVKDIPSLTLSYANILAQDAFYIEENYEITYTFSIVKGTAKLDQFQIISTILGSKKINMQWDVVIASVTYSAQRYIKIQRNRRRRRWLFGGHRRCTWKLISRGVNKDDIKKIQEILHSTMKKVGVVSRSGGTFIRERVIDMKSTQSSGSCAAWNPVIKLSLARGCLRLESAPAAFGEAVDPSI